MTKFVSPCPRPEGLQRELLDILTEECLEVGHRVSKALRFGLDEVQPGQPLSNSQRIAEEVGDLFCVVDWLCQKGIISRDDIDEAMTRKHEKLMKYLQSDWST